MGLFENEIASWEKVHPDVEVSHLFFESLNAIRICMHLKNDPENHVEELMYVTEGYNKNVYQLIMRYMEHMNHAYKKLYFQNIKRKGG